MERYKTSHGCVVNKNTEVIFNRTKDGELHIKIVTFDGKKSVVLSEGTFIDIERMYALYRANDYGQS